MDNILEQKQEALKAAGEYLEKLIPGMETLCKELRGDRQDDTEDFKKQCIDGLNWIIEIYNRISDIIDEDAIHIEKSALNESIISLGGAIRYKDDIKTADIIGGEVIPFLKDLAAAANVVES